MFLPPNSILGAAIPGMTNIFFIMVNEYFNWETFGGIHQKFENPPTSNKTSPRYPSEFAISTVFKFSLINSLLSAVLKNFNESY